MTVSQVQNINSKLTLDWNITRESIDESEAVSKSYHAIISFQDFTDFFGDPVEKTNENHDDNKYTAESRKYLGEFIKSQVDFKINILPPTF